MPQWRNSFSKPPLRTPTIKLTNQKSEKTIDKAERARMIKKAREEEIGLKKEKDWNESVRISKKMFGY